MPAAPPVGSARPRRVLAVLVLAAVLIWLDATVLNTALERLAEPGRGLGANPGQLQWVVGAYALVFATALFAAGALGDRYGHRRLLLGGLGLFGVASVAAAWSATPTELVVARGVMGAGGAMVMPSSMAVIGSAFPVERRPAAIAAWSSSAGVGLAAGPLLGGVLVDHFWWGSVFLVNVPVVLAAVVGVVLVVPEVRPARRRRPDPIGVLLSTAGLFGVAYGLIEGGHSTDWARSRVWGSIAVGVVLLALFVLVELRSREPSFDPRLFRVGRFAAGNAALGALFFAAAGQAFYGPLFLQGARGLSAVTAGLTQLPAAAGVIVGSPLAARLARRHGVAAVAGTGLAVAAVAIGLNVCFGLGTSLVWFCLVGGLAGLGIGLTIAPTTAAVLGTLPPDRMGAGAAVNNTLRQVGSVLGVATLGTVLSTAYRDRIRPSLAGLPDQAAGPARASAEAARQVARAFGRPDLAVAADRAFVHAMHVAALCGAAGVLFGAVLLAVAFRRGAVAPAGAPVPAEPPAVVAEPAPSAAVSPGR